jgi:uncharacterized protein (TIGR03435 family)
VVSAFGGALFLTALAQADDWRSGRAQTQPPEFEVVSVKPAKPMIGRRGGVAMGGTGAIRWDPGMLRATNISLKSLIREAFTVKDYQISGAADWFDSEGYDVEAKTGAESSREEQRLMLQKMLADRFQLRYHRDAKEIQALGLLVAKGGFKMHELKEGDPDPRAGRPLSANGMGGIRAAGSMEQLADMASQLLQIPVLNKTGTDGRYDLSMQFGPVDMDTALREALRQFGLELKPLKAKMQILVIEHADRVPSGN